MNILQKYAYLAMEMLVETEEIGVYGGSDAKLMVFDAIEFMMVNRELLTMNSTFCGEPIGRAMDLVKGVSLVYGGDLKMYRICQVPDIVNVEPQRVELFGVKTKKMARNWEMATEINKIVLCWDLKKTYGLKAWLGIDDEFKVVCFESAGYC